MLIIFSLVFSCSYIKKLIIETRIFEKCFSGKKEKIDFFAFTFLRLIAGK